MYSLFHFAKFATSLDENCLKDSHVAKLTDICYQ
jgi:hypothetical protein